MQTNTLNFFKSSVKYWNKSTRSTFCGLDFSIDLMSTIVDTFYGKYSVKTHSTHGALRHKQILDLNNIQLVVRTSQKKPTEATIFFFTHNKTNKYIKVIRFIEKCHFICSWQRGGPDMRESEIIANQSQGAALDIITVFFTVSWPGFDL